MGNEALADLPVEARKQVRRHAGEFSPAEILRMIRLFNAAATDLRGSWQPSLALELALAESLEPPAGSAVPPVASPPGKKEPPASRPAPASGREDPGRGGKPPVRPAEAAKPPAADASAPASHPDAGRPAFTLEQIAKVWKQVCAVIKPQSQPLNALLNSSRLVEVKGGVLQLGFASEILRSKADTPEQIELIRAALTAALGVDVPVRCVLSNAKQSAPPDVKQNGMVAAALKKGGEIVDIQE